MPRMSVYFITEAGDKEEGRKNLGNILMRPFSENISYWNLVNDCTTTDWL